VNSCPLAVVGAGPAGLGIAIAAAESGLDVVLVDENQKIGGQIYRQASLAESDRDDRHQPAKRFVALSQRLGELSQRITMIPRTRVWGIFEQTLALAGPSPCFLRADRIALAPGAHEFVPPFPGWTLPGVMTAGAAQRLVKSMQVAPGQRVILVGTGPFLLTVANSLLDADVQVVAVVEASRRRDWLWRLPSMASARMSLVLEGWRYLRRIRSAKIPLLTGHVITRATGPSQVESVTVAPCSRDWAPDHSRARTFDVDALCVGYGFVPRTQMAQLAGCKVKYVSARGGWIPELSVDGQTSQPRIWCAGDGAGIGGALLAELSGRLVGLSIARDCNALSETEYVRLRAPVCREVRRLQRFRDALESVSRIRSGLFSLADEDTHVCRCEEVTLGEVEEALQAGCSSMRELKIASRIGMGPCQGTMCWRGIAELACQKTGQSPESFGPLSIRPPIQPIGMGELAKLATDGPEGPG